MSDQENAGLTASPFGGTSAEIRAAIEQHQAAIFAFVLRLTGDATLAEDILQETFLAALRGASTFRGEGSPRSWLLTIARNTARSMARRRHETPTEEESLERLGEAAGFGCEVSPEEALEEHQQQQMLERAMAALPEADREVLLLRDVEGLSGEETAAVLGLPLAAMKSRLHRARLRLVAGYDQQCKEFSHGRS